MAGINVMSDSTGKEIVNAILCTEVTQDRINEINAKAEEVKKSIPSNYTDLIEEVSQLSDEINDLEDNLSHMNYTTVCKNLIGNEDGVHYPVYIKSGDKVTVSVSDGSSFVPGYKLIFEDKNKATIDYYTLSTGSLNRTIVAPGDTYYLRLNPNAYPVPLQVEKGSSVTEYEQYFFPAIGLNMLINDLNVDVEQLHLELNKFTSKFFSGVIQTIPNNISLLNPVNITAGVYSFGPSQSCLDYPPDWDGSLYGTLYYFSPNSIILHQPTTGGIWIKKSTAGWTTLNNNSIYHYNKDKIQLIQQMTYGKPTYIGNNPSLSFIHFSDIHARQTQWNRIQHFANDIKENISFLIHTGDYVRNDQGNTVDLYANGYNSDLPTLNVVGNHDIYTNFTNRIIASKEVTKNIVMPNSVIASWGATFGTGDFPMHYYKDFANEKVRLVVLDYYYNLEEQVNWLTTVLADAKSLGYHVLTATHEVTSSITTFFDNTFCSLDADALTTKGGLNKSSSPFDNVIKTFKDNGGVHIANICGHEHIDMMGATSNGVTNIVIGSCLGLDETVSDVNRIEGTSTWDLLNCVRINTGDGTISLVRLGADVDRYMRSRRTLCYDYINGVLISNT